MEKGKKKRKLKGLKEGLQENSIIAVFVLVFSFGVQFMFFGLSTSRDWDTWVSKQGSFYWILAIVLGMFLMIFSLYLIKDKEG